MKAKHVLIALFVLALGLSALIAAQAADKVVDPVCGMAIDKDGAKWSFDYKDTTYYFCCEACKTAFAKEPEKFLAKMAAKKAVAGAVGASCEKAAAAECQKEIVKVVVVKDGDKMTVTAGKECPLAAHAEMASSRNCPGCCCPRMKMRMAHGMGMHGRMMPPAPPAPPAPGAPAAPPAAPMHRMAGCPGQPSPAPSCKMGTGAMGMGMMGMGLGMECGLMSAEDLEKKIENTKDGVVITLSSKNPETVKKIQEHIAQMAKHQAEMMKKMEGMKKEVKIEVVEKEKEKK